MNTTTIDRDEELALIAKAQSGDTAARDQLVASQYRWVWRIAKRFTHRCRWVEIEDLVQVGLIGLCRAISKFDLASGNRLTTYSFHQIRAHIQRELDTAGIVRMNAAAKKSRNSGLRDKAWNSRTINITDQMRGFESSSDDFVDHELAKRRLEVIKTVVGDLKPKLRTSLERYISGDTLESEATELGVTKEAVRQRRLRAIAFLQEKIRQREPELFCA